jgi:hypothetical protein
MSAKWSELTPGRVAFGAVVISITAMLAVMAVTLLVVSLSQSRGESLHSMNETLHIQTRMLDHLMARVDTLEERVAGQASVRSEGQLPQSEDGPAR